LSLLKKGNHDLVHFPHWNVPVFYHRPFVVTIHDLTMFHFPRYEATTRSYPVFYVKDKVHRMVVKNAVGRASQIIATSQFTKSDIISTLHISEEKISVIYQAPAVETTVKNWEALQSKYDVRRPYILYVGAAYPHKNLQRLVDAWNMVETNFPEHELILIGKPSEFYTDLMQYIKKMNIPRVQNIGFVEDEDLGAYYTHAAAVIFPSLYEGFGLPPLEAMAVGTPVIASSASCLPEVLGEGAYYVNPEDTSHIADGIAAVLGDQALQSELRYRGREHARSFSSESFVKNTLSVYKKALSQPE